VVVRTVTLRGAARLRKCYGWALAHTQMVMSVKRWGIMRQIDRERPPAEMAYFHRWCVQAESGVVPFKLEGVVEFAQSAASFRTPMAMGPRCRNRFTLR